ncbi:pectate lyase [Neorhodopirellula pilleata]|uniref:Pectic acid lyase n=1 Tax=Neorhodopirellula pilleata TaxID=2714738 RepID=A0A5C6AV88_9BACT|nr:pectate lyase [Neorhodopirellula pilleata]TWU03883.1 Pectic acid lyase [Neorhodopirellula pilleata]
MFVLSRNIRVAVILIGVVAGIFQSARVQAQDQLTTLTINREIAAKALRDAGGYFHQQVARHGGYVYHTMLDTNQRWGEGIASEDQIWVQPPGTPTVGLAFLRAYFATNDPALLDAARDAAESLVAGQLKSGGWTNCIDFDPKGSQVADYRNLPGRGRNNSSLDDGQTQSALLFLMAFDEATEFQNASVHGSVGLALEALLAAQFGNGGFPQVWTGPINKGISKKASLPEQDAQTVTRIKNYWDMATLNDNVTGYVADVLIEADRIYNDPKFLKRLIRLGGFLKLAQLPSPQAGWAQQYDDEMRPIWARKFEPPAVSSDETMEVLETLMKISLATGDRSFLEPIPAAAKWLQASRLPAGDFARYYECGTNRPLYMKRVGKNYELTYDDSDLPDHYAFKIADRTATLGQKYKNVLAGKPLQPQTPMSKITQQAVTAIASLDDEHRWVSVYDGARLVGQPKMPIGARYLSSEMFAENMMAIADYVRMIE